MNTIVLTRHEEIELNVFRLTCERIKIDGIRHVRVSVEGGVKIARLIVIDNNEAVVVYHKRLN